MGTTESKMGPEAFDCIIEESKRGSCLPASATSTTVWIHSEGHASHPASDGVSPASPKCSPGTSKGQDQPSVPSKDGECTSRNGSCGAIGHKNHVQGKDRQLASGGDGRGGPTNRGFGLGALTAVKWRGPLASGNGGDGNGDGDGDSDGEGGGKDGGKARGRGDGDRSSGDSEGTDGVGDTSGGEKSSEEEDVCWWDTEEEEEEGEQGGEVDDSSSSESRGDDSRGSRVSSTASLQGVSADSDSSWSSASSSARSGSSGSSSPRSASRPRSGGSVSARAGVGSSSARSSVGRSSRAERRRSKAPSSFSVKHARLSTGNEKVDACAQAGEGALLSEGELMEEKTLAQLKVQFHACLLELGRERFHLEVVKQEEAQARRQLTSKFEGVIEGLKDQIRDQELLLEKMLDRLEQGKNPGIESAGRGSGKSDRDGASAKMEVLQQSNVELTTELDDLRRKYGEQDVALRRAHDTLAEVETDKRAVTNELETTRKALETVLEQDRGGGGGGCREGRKGTVGDSGMPWEGVIGAGIGVEGGGGEGSCAADDLENSSGFMESITDEEESQGSDGERAGEPERVSEGLGGEREDGDGDGDPRRMKTTA